MISIKKALPFVPIFLLLVAACSLSSLKGRGRIQTVQHLDNLPSFNAQDALSVSPSADNDMVSLFMNDKFVCTAFVIDNKYALTAAHCLVDERSILTKQKISVRTDQFVDLGTEAQAASINLRSDVGLIRGDFEMFKKASFSRTGFFNHRGPFVTCGFAWGGKPPMCTIFSPVGPFYDKIKGLGFLYPGMSGGPVIDTSSGEVVGINDAMDDGYQIVAPLINIFAQLEIKEEGEK